MVIAAGIAVGGAVLGASVPVVLASNWRSLRKRRTRPRVLVLAPDGCVVGLPSGPRAFSWPEVARFEAGAQPMPQKPLGPARPCLDVYLQGGECAGRIDGAWFAEPLELIVAVAEAYRVRHQ
jgi:hypothetical protein